MKTPDQLQTAQDFLDFFEAIPEEKWCTTVYENEDGQRCAEGHLIYAGGLTHNLVHKMEKLFPAHFSIIRVNDGVGAYNLPTPKQRICAALRDAVAQGK